MLVTSHSQSQSQSHTHSHTRSTNVPCKKRCQSVILSKERQTRMDSTEQIGKHSQKKKREKKERKHWTSNNTLHIIHILSPFSANVHLQNWYFVFHCSCLQSPSWRVGLSSGIFWTRSWSLTSSRHIYKTPVDILHPLTWRPQAWRWEQRECVIG